MVFDFNRIYIGCFILTVFIISYFFNLDYLILLLITLLVFYDLYKSKLIENINDLFLSIFFLFFICLIGIKFNLINYINILFIVLTLIILLKKNFYQRYLFTITIIIFLFNFYEIINHDRELLYFIIFISFFNDTLAYIFGKLIKGPLILPLVSPKKTISGTLLSFLATFAIIYTLNYPFYLSIVLSMSLFIGDIFFSFIKRTNNLKDFSNILKGHGGVLDRLDSMFFFTIIINYYL